MGVRLVIHNFEIDELDYTGTHNHDDLLHRDWVDQHPIYAITGLQEILNTIEANIVNVIKLIQTNDENIHQELNNYATNERVTDIDTQINARIDALNVLDNPLNTDSVLLTYDSDNNSLKADVIVYNDPNDTNALILSQEGLYVPKMVTKDTDTITWDSVSPGETLHELFTSGLRFSHNGTTNNLYYPDEANAWYWDDELYSFVQPLNTTSYTGFVTHNVYDAYEWTVRLNSPDTDTDVNGVVIGFVFDDNGYPHTLSALIQRGIDFGSYKFALYYDYCLPNQTFIGNYNLINSNDGWSGNNITLYITKAQNLVRVSATAWNYNNTLTSLEGAESMPFEYTYNIDLDNYSFGHFFSGKVRYGYSNQSQPDSYYDHAFFYSRDKHSADVILANVKVQETEHNAIEVNENGLFVKEFIIADDPNNAISHREDGYFVKATAMNIANQRLNGLEQPSLGEYYVHKSHSFVTVTQSSHGFIVGDFIYYDNRTNKYQKAIAKDDFDINIVGMVSYLYNADKFEYVCSGIVETNLFDETHGYVQGMPLYISDFEAGKVTQEQPDISKAVGYPIANIGLIISIERGIQYNQEDKIGDFKTSANNYNIRSDGFIRIAENVEYKLSIVNRLLEYVDVSFIQQYITTNDATNTLRFINTSQLYTLHNVPTGLNLFIKAF